MKLKQICSYISLLIVLLTIFASIITSQVKAQDDIASNYQKIQDCDEKLEQISDLVLDHETRVSVVETHFEHISEQLTRIEDKLE